MLTVITNLKSFRFSRRALEVKFGLTLVEWSLVSAMGDYARMLELEGALKDEPYTTMLVYEALGVLSDPVTVPREVGFTFNCSDRPIGVEYNKKTLARHFLLIANFIEAYPDETSITVDHSSATIQQVLLTVLEDHPYELTDERLYALQMLTPVSDAYYLLFNLAPRPPSFVLSLLGSLSENERRDILRSYSLQRQYALSTGVGNMSRLELPGGGEGLSIGFAFLTVREYIITHSLPELTDPFPSYIFLNMLIRRYNDEVELPVREFLLKSTFDDDSGFLHSEEDLRLVLGGVALCITHSDWDGICHILTMLGIKHPLLKNEHLHLYLPYQIEASKGPWIGCSEWEVLKNSARGKIDEEAFSTIMGPYIQRRR